MPGASPGAPGLAGTRWYDSQREGSIGQSCLDSGGPPGQRSGPCGDTGHAENLAAAKQFDLPWDGTPRHRQAATRRAEPVNVWAHGYLVVGTRGLCRLVLVVASCPFCRRPHAHNGRPDFGTGKRQASCRGGRYVVHLGSVEGQVAV